MAQSIRVAVIGPNLRDQSKGELHVHAAGCADIAKMAEREPEYRNPWEIDATSIQDVVTATYPPKEFDYSPDDDEYGAYESCFYFFPCVHFSKAKSEESVPVGEMLYCEAGHRWMRRRVRGKKPRFCPDHKPVSAPAPKTEELQRLTCKAGHEWTREPQRGKKPEWCPEHKPQPVKPSEGRTARESTTASGATRVSQRALEILDGVTERELLRAGDDLRLKLWYVVERLRTRTCESEALMLQRQKELVGEYDRIR